MKKSLKKKYNLSFEAYEREHNGGSNKKGKNTQVVSKKKKEVSKSIPGPEKLKIILTL